MFGFVPASVIPVSPVKRSLSNAPSSSGQFHSLKSHCCNRTIIVHTQVLDTPRDVYKSGLKLGDSGIRELFEDLSSEGSKIGRLSLDNNEIGMNGVKYLATFLKESSVASTVFELTLSGNDLDAEGVLLLVNALRNSKCKVLDFSRNQISSDGADAMFAEISKSRALKAILLNGNHLDNECIKTEGFKTVLQRSSGPLWYIDLRQNDISISDDICETIQLNRKPKHVILPFDEPVPCISTMFRPHNGLCRAPTCFSLCCKNVKHST
uniref:Uncharacterized protein n=1 Tax=Timspurckia oligopyrenoides TaxID=708627 RepID=A0A7S1ES81_9RHOD